MKKKHNIMHLVLNLNIGGLEWVVINLLKRLDKDRFSPSAACLLDGGTLVNEVKKLGFELDILNKPDKLDFSAFLRLAKILKEKKIDLIHTHNTGAYIYGGIAAKIAGVNALVHTEHGRCFPDKKRLMWTEKILSAFTHSIIAVSEDLKEKLVEFEKIDPRKISVIPNGIDVDLFKPTERQSVEQKKEELGLDKDIFIVGTVGRLDPIKDHRNLIEAFKIAEKYMPAAKLLIAGDGPLMDSLKLKVESLKLQEKVKFLGERNDIVELLNVFDLFVLPSKSEGVSLTLLEAMAARKPIIATDVAGNKEILEHGKDGYLVPACSTEKLSEAILYLAKNPAMAFKLRNAAYVKVRQKYSLENMISRYQDIYASALIRN